jgi:NadR type nicotinamide-nucleotide adenylyltransferase
LSIQKIVVIGPECTGKSTLSEAFAKELKTVWVKEYAREYLEKLGRTYQEADLLEIAKGQLEAEARLEGKANKYLVCDTDLQVMKVWSEHKYGRCDSWILEQIAIRRYDLYLLTDIDIAWQEDEQREHPTEEMRRYFHKMYKEIVTNSGVPFTEVSGNMAERLTTSLSAIESLPKK